MVTPQGDAGGFLFIQTTNFMKNFTSNWKKWSGHAICVCAAALFSMSFAACSDAYDDSVLVDRIDKLEDRVDAIEAKLNEQVSALQVIAEQVNGLGIKSCTYNEETGIYTVVMADGTTVSIQTDLDALGIVTAKEAEDGKLYWAINGEFIMDGNGNKVSVVVTPKVQVNKDTKRYEVSVDGGVTWVPTDLVFEEKEPVVLKDIAVSDDGRYIEFTQADGSVLKVPNAEFSFTCSLLAGKQYFAAGETRTLSISLIGAKKNMIITPGGWNAEIEGKELTITAPEAGVAAAELKGKIQIMAFSETGQGDFLELSVEVGEAPYVIALDKGGKYTIIPSEATANDPNWKGFLYKVADVNSFFNLERIYEEYNVAGTDPTTLSKGEVQGTIANYASEYSYVVMVFDVYEKEGKAYVYTPENWIYVEYSEPVVKVEFSDVIFGDATLDLLVKGYDDFWWHIATFDPENAAGQTKEEWIAEQKTRILEYAGYDNMLFGRYFSYYLPGIGFNNAYNGSLAAFNVQLAYCLVRGGMAPGQTAFFGILPTRVEKVAENIVYDTFDLPMPVLDATSLAEVTFTDKKRDYTQVEVAVTPGENTSQYQWAWMTAEELETNNTDELKMKALMESYWYGYADERTFQKNNLEPGAKVTMVVVAVDRAGKAKIFTHETTTNSVVFNESTVEAKLTITSFTGVSVALTPSDEEIVSYKWYNWVKTYYDGNFAGKDGDALAEKDLITKSGWKSESATIEINNLQFNNTYVFIAVGLDAQGLPTHMTKVVYSPSDDFNAHFDETLTAQPTISKMEYRKLKEDWTTYTDWDDLNTLTAWTFSQRGQVGDYRLTIDWGAIQVKNCWMMIDSYGALGYASTVKDKAATVLSYGIKTDPVEGAYTCSGYLEYGYAPLFKVYIAWEDQEGNYYPCMEIDPTSFFKKE